MSQKYFPLDTRVDLPVSDTEIYPKESFQLYDFHLKSYLDDLSPDENFQFNARPCTQHLLNQEPFDFHQFVPYQLQLEKSGLFPEFYFHFRRAFAAMSIENRAYCSTSLEIFKSFFIGSAPDIQSSIVRVENDYELKFRKCLGPELLKEFSSWYLTRSCVETRFREKLRENVDLISYSHRVNELTSRARDYEVLPLVDFLMAYEHSESSIWHHVLIAFSNDTQSEKRIQYLNTKAVEWKNVDISLTRQIQGFVSDLREEDIQNSDPDACLVFTFCVCLVIVFFMIVVMARS
ncbi:hypothetical protein METBIDRAFT_83818 [Metschnikowia bicuspidata var. bicuspidata NRRL YB-4993]|uniref:Uncharacterized protein n=1 Tax=Metschnikowia bicuspidata var. bicuspidata NRRL YB-4993 TaxID=869754 RepID=A0A1A0H738_9ASCO|nr:hypothetical protein METBIDRAFT_83818 [Metschnikowia bicuspidata var. bicuspidata NRRL YB-4993]OBA19713.1 hypothetical protein METBIDRAFT_83818 [Metschnikowia bicuspidata var. bicuspidata NRRL YB-4993]